ncbi:hypothetical protein [Rhizobium gallicum]|uniref:hypothetical protein n=1 Tax=Rhizobium gallicum TaxID=56730 RepID=UPI001EF99EE6|nr:hypothetical protein [Rhizobium gallicum]ULJ72646.1 hypothetical protein L2W42_02830 [Rhizobium gallicum]
MTTTVLFMLFSLWLVFATQYREGMPKAALLAIARERRFAGWKESSRGRDGRSFFFVLFSFQVRFGALLISATKQCAWEGQA